MARRLKRTKTDTEFLDAVSDALTAYKASKGVTNTLLAEELGIDESTVAGYIRKEAPIMAEVLARACINLGLQVYYKNYVISAASFPGAATAVPASPAQLEFRFDAGYSDEKGMWRMSHDRAEPMEFTLRIKIAS